jgi:polar amino acid transport system substrate-binding protein/glutamate/aspartate transport system substrate-binding protein
MTIRSWLLGGCALALLAAPASAATLERIDETGVIKLGVRTDARPFSYRNAEGEAAGYSVALCLLVAEAVADKVGRDELEIETVDLTADDRFQAVADGNVDILCGASTMTLARREIVDFSLPTFTDGASVLFRADGPASLEALAGGKIGVRDGTTTETALRATLQEAGIAAEVVAVTDHEDGLRRLENNEIGAYFADRAILTFLLIGSENRDALRLSERYFTYETHALAVPRDDADFRLVVDSALAQLYRSGRVAELFRAAFGPDARPSQPLELLYILFGLPAE